MGKKVDATGQQYGRLTAISPTQKRTKGGGVVWLFACSCGKQKEAPLNSARSGLIKSCGCLSKPHGMKRTRIYNIWVDMRQRCTNPKYTEFHLYGGRGITVCREWDDFLTFYKWAKESGYSDTLSIDRIDVNGNYCPGNCRWATPKEQALNTRRTVKVSIGDETKLLGEWCKIYNIAPCTVYRRMRQYGWGLEKAITTQNLRRKPPKEEWH